MLGVNECSYHYYGETNGHLVKVHNPFSIYMGLGQDASSPSRLAGAKAQGS